MGDMINYVTISFGYADSLRNTFSQQILGIRVIVTVPDDLETRRVVLAAKNSELFTLDCAFDGVGFHAAYNKARYLNIGLRELRRRGARGWVILLDADILLPGDFGERLEALLPLLDKGKLYGLRGRRVAATGEEFVGVRELGPWEAGLETFTTVVGYFNLFHLQGPHREYPASDPRRVEHDDYRFYSLFGKANTGVLPMAALHLGKTYVNWGGQTEVFGSGTPNSELRTLNFERGSRDSGGSRGSGKVRSSKFGVQSSEFAALPSHQPTLALLLGAWLPEAARELAAVCGQLLVVDSRGLSRASGDVLEEADREFLWRRFAEGLAGVGNVGLVEDGGKVSQAFQPVRVGSTGWKACGTLAGRRAGLPVVPVPGAGSVGWLQLGVEPSYDFLLGELPRWLRCLEPGGWIAGTHYGQPFFPQTTPVIELLLGTPERRGAAGGWALRYRPEGSPLRRSEEERRADAVGEKRGVVLWVRGRDEVQRVITSLHALRVTWAGAVAVVYDGEEVPALRIACALHDAAFFPLRASSGALVAVPLNRSGQAGTLRGALGACPFAETLFLTPECGEPAVKRWFSALAKSDGMVASPELVGLPVAFAFRREVLLPLLARWEGKKRTFYTLESELPMLLQRRVKMRLARALSATRLDAPEHELALVAARPAHVWLPEDCTVVTAVMREDIEPLQRSWRALRWPAGGRRLVVRCFESTEGTEARTEKAAAGVSLRSENSWLPEGAEDCPLSAKAVKALAGEPYWTQALLSAAYRVRTRYLLYLDPCMTPLPGAELFPEAGDAAYCGSGWCFIRRGKAVLKTPKLGPPATLIERAWLLKAAEAFARRRRKADTFEVFLHARAKAERRPVVVADVMARGWSR